MLRKNRDWVCWITRTLKYYGNQASLPLHHWKIYLQLCQIFSWIPSIKQRNHGRTSGDAIGINTEKNLQNTRTVL